VSSTTIADGNPASGRPSSPISPPARLIRTNYRHDREGCGERVPSPDWYCQSRADPFLAGERFHLSSGSVIVCNRCGRAWREVAA
jgi:hypothetical protein